MEKADIQRAQTTIVTIAVAAAGFVLGSVAIGHVMNDLGAAILVVGGCTALLSAIAIRIALGVSRSPSTATGATIGLTIAAATLCSPMSFVLIGVFDEGFHEPFGILGAGLMAFVIGLVFTLPLGLVFSIAYAPLVGLVQRATRDRSYESLEVTIRNTGAWLVFVAGFAALFTLPIYGAHRIPDTVVTGLLITAAILANVGLLAAAVAGWRIARRRQWFGRVLLDHEPGWTVVADAGPVLVTSELRPLFIAEEPPEGFLVRRREGVANGAYRTGEEMVPVARV